MVQSTCVPATARPAASVALTTSGFVSGSPTSALWLLPETIARAEAAAARAVSVNDTVTDGALWSEALIEAAPATEPTVYKTCVVPSAPVVELAAPSTPPPETMVQSTCVPATARPAASVALTTSGFVSGSPTSALWLLPETIARAEAAAARAVSVNDTVTDGALWSAALIEAAPATEPTVYKTCVVPSAPVVELAAPSTPPPETMVQSTCVPATARPAASVALTTSGFVSGSPTSALWLLPETIARAEAAAARAVSVNDTVTDGALWSAALIEAAPATEPTVYKTCVVPSAPVVELAAPSTPPPETMVQSTCVPATARPAASVALTTSGFVSGSPTSALWLLPETIARAEAAAARAVSVNDTVTDGALWSAALIEAAPATEPTVYKTCVVPSEPVVEVAAPSTPPPETIVQSTCAPPTARPAASVALTTSGLGNANPTRALWLLPETMARAEAAAASAVSVNDTVTDGAL